MEIQAYKKHCVYALIKNKNCIYVGCTNDLKNRISKHKLNKHFDDYIIISNHNSKKEALLAERSIIKFLSIFGGSELLNCKYELLSFKAQSIYGLVSKEKNY